MLTNQEALAAIDPSLPPEERAELASRVVASSAALDAYYDSRPQLEQIIAQAQGHGQVSTFAKLNPTDGKPAVDPAKAAAIDSTAEEVPVESAEDKELKELESRVAALQAAKGA